MQPLKGTVVLDLSKVLAGPLCAQILGDFGAEVIKVEPVEGGDEMRTWQPQEDGHSVMFLYMNRNKRSLAVDLKSEEGKAVIERLVKSADVVIQGFATGVAERLGVDYTSLSKIKPDIVYCEISGFGREGPLGTKPGYDVMAQAFSGILSTLGEPGGPVTRVSFSPIDQGTGMHAATGILAALMERGRTGKGSYLSASLFETALGFVGYMAQNYWHTGRLPRRMGSAHEAAAPYQAFEASDGGLMIGVGNDSQWARLCKAFGMEELIADPRFVTTKERVSNFDAVTGIVAEKVKTAPIAHWIELLDKARIPCSPINTIADVLQHEQTAVSGIVVETDHPALGKVRSIGYPVRFDKQPRASYRHAPLHGEHTMEILTEIGFSKLEIDDLDKSKRIYVNRTLSSDDAGGT